MYPDSQGIDQSIVFIIQLIQTNLQQQSALKLFNDMR